MRIVFDFSLDNGMHVTRNRIMIITIHCYRLAMNVKNKDLFADYSY